MIPCERHVIQPFAFDNSIEHYLIAFNRRQLTI